jgi:hypothetical protein
MGWLKKYIPEIEKAVLELISQNSITQEFSTQKITVCISSFIQGSISA